MCRVSVWDGELRALVTLTGLVDVSSEKKSMLSFTPQFRLSSAGLCPGVP